MSGTDLELLARFTRKKSEDAFTELVRRHVNLVYSAALRQVRSPQLAEDVAQSVFADLARNASKLKSDTVLSAWLYQVTRRTAIDVVRREARRQLCEQIATEMNALNASSDDWTQIEPLLDDAMQALDETDRTAVLLRFFENKPLREVGQQLGVSDDAAQKRVSRAVERLREYFIKHGIIAGTSGLASVISANAIHAAPVGLALTISSAAATIGTSAAATTTATTAAATATKAVAMTTLHKTVIGATLAAAIGVGVYEAAQNLELKAQLASVQEGQAPLEEQLHQLREEQNSLHEQLVRTGEQNERLRQGTIELLSLRGKVGGLRRRIVTLAHLGTENAQLRQLLNLDSNEDSATNDIPIVSVVDLTRIGNAKNVSDEMIRANISVKPGDFLDRAIIHSDVTNLYSSGAFQNIRVAEQLTTNGVTLNYLVQEKPTIKEIRLTGGANYEQLNLAGVLTSRVGTPLDERDLFNDKESLEQLFRRAGLSNPRVNYSIEVNEDSGEGTVVFNILN